MTVLWFVLLAAALGLLVSAGLRREHHRTFPVKPRGRGRRRAHRGYTTPRRPSNAEMLQALAVAQGGRCATCQRVRRLVLDHDHATGLVRGALCSTCNGSEGGYRFDARFGTTPPPEVFAAYRASPPAAWRKWSYVERRRAVGVR